MNAGRTLVLAATLGSGSALDEQGPPSIPTWLRPALRPLARAATMAFVRKYELRLEETEVPTRAVRSALERLRVGLASASPYLLGTFSYADIVMATLIQGISPVADRFVKLGPATRAAWTHATLAADFADLVAWRDALYETQRRAASR